ncbi:MAG: hypothetical protein WC982_03775 [Advenella sp.]
MHSLARTSLQLRHRDTTGRRWHYVSLPASLGLGREAELLALGVCSCNVAPV